MADERSDDDVPTLAYSARPAGDGDAIEIPGYRIVRRLGEGGMGAVWLAEEIALGRLVAIKVVSDRIARDAEARARFLREARLLATVEHPNVVRVYTFGTVGERPYLVMEYVEGETLAQRIRDGRTRDVGEALPIVRRIVDALDAAWERRIIHRDIKPSNVLFDRRGELKVADFGLAKGVSGPGEHDATLTQSGYLLGSPHYIAPEQARGAETDFRTDIYSLGILLFEMLTGRRPFEAPSPMAIVARHLSEPLPRPDGVPENVADLIAWMTEKDPAKRPSSYAELLANVAAPPRSRRMRVTRSAALLLLLVLALVLFRQPRASEPRRDGRLVVVVAPFYGPDADSTREGRVMAALVEKSVHSRLGGDVRVVGLDEVPTAPRNNDAARSLGERFGASVVIWGEAYVLRDETEIQPSVTIVPRPKSDAANDARVASAGLESLEELQSGAPAAVRLQSQAPNQIELRRTSAEGIGDLVTFVAATHALHDRENPRRALALLSQMRRTADSAYQKAICLVQLQRDGDAVRELHEALTLDPAHAPSLALLADFDARAGRYAEAVGRLRAAAATQRPFSGGDAVLLGDKLYVKERYLERTALRETANLLAIEPATGRVLERHRLSGIPRAMTVEGEALVIRTDDGETVRLTNGKLERPVAIGGSALTRMRSMRAGWRYAANFLSEIATVRPNPIVRPRFRFSAEDAEPSAPQTLPELRAALEAAIARDPAQPWYAFHLGLTLDAMGDRAGAERAWQRVFSAPSPATAYWEFSWMARQWEGYGFGAWADRAYAEALRRRRVLPVPIQSATHLERMLNAPFVRAAALRANRNPIPDRDYLWLQRTRELTGLSAELDEVVSLAWMRWFESKSNRAAAAVERNIAERARGLADALLRIFALADILTAATFAAGIVLLVLLLRDRRQVVLGALALAIIAAAAMMATRAAQSRLTVLIGLSDSLGDAQTIAALERRLRIDGRDDLRFVTAVANHLGGNRDRARDLYRGLQRYERAQQNLDALDERAAIAIPTRDEVVRALRPSPLRALLRDLAAPYRVWFGGGLEEDHVDWLIRMFALTISLAIGIALVALVLFRNARRPSMPIRLVVALFALAFIGSLTVSHRIGTSRQEQGLSMPGPFAVRYIARYEASVPFPPMPDAETARREAYAGSSLMRTYWACVIAAALIAVAAAGSLLFWRPRASMRERARFEMWWRRGASNV